MPHRLRREFEWANKASMDGLTTKVHGTDFRTRSHSSSSAGGAWASKRATILKSNASVISLGEMRMSPPRGNLLGSSNVAAATTGGSSMTPGFRVAAYSSTRRLDIGTSGVQEMSKFNQKRFMPQVYCMASARPAADCMAAAKAVPDHGSTNPEGPPDSGDQVDTGSGSAAASPGHCAAMICKAFETSAR